MSNITKIKDKETGVIYPIEDSEAREDISELKSQIGNLNRLETEAKTDLVSAINTIANKAVNNIPYAVKQAMDNMFANATFDSYDASNDLVIFHNWASELSLVSISAVFNQTGTVSTMTSLEALRQYLTVTGMYDDGTTEEITDYTLSGELTEGTSVITVAFESLTTTFNVTVTGQDLPSDYHRLAYIESNGRQQLQKTISSISNASTLRAVVEYYKQSKPNKAIDLLAVRNPNTNSLVWELGFAYNLDNTVYLYSSSSVKTTSPIVYGHRTVADAVFSKTSPYASLSLIADDVTASNSKTSANNSAQWDATAFYIFGSGESLLDGRIYQVQLYVDNVLVFEGVPCYRVADNEVGMYDTVSGSFLVNTGTGAFTYGEL